ncbi:hypothetical protein, partial [Steroidobacter cummioxidans]|uniref:hypothetical protein n=1 Tax=Steroidobacter cummioxidans TaxID=1803913 RepID=UPI0019D44F9B
QRQMCIRDRISYLPDPTEPFAEPSADILGRIRREGAHPTTTIGRCSYSVLEGRKILCPARHQPARATHPRECVATPVSTQ